MAVKTFLALKKHELIVPWRLTSSNPSGASQFDARRPTWSFNRTIRELLHQLATNASTQCGKLERSGDATAWS